MANISLCFGSNPCVKPLIVACRSTSTSHDTDSDSGSSSCSGSGSGLISTNYYKLLSLSSKKAGTQEIKRAYRTLALQYHPDVSRHDHDTTKMFVLLQTAYKTLVDPVSREEYDWALECREAAAGRVRVDCAFGDLGQEGRRRWEGQIVELQRRSSFGSERKEGSWGSRARYANRRNKES